MSKLIMSLVISVNAMAAMPCETNADCHQYAFCVRSFHGSYCAAAMIAEYSYPNPYAATLQGQLRGMQETLRLQQMQEEQLQRQYLQQRMLMQQYQDGMFPSNQLRPLTMPNMVPNTGIYPH